MLTIELEQEEPMSQKSPSKVLAAAAAVVIAVVIVGVVWAARDDSADPVATQPSIDDAASTTTEPPDLSPIVLGDLDASSLSPLASLSPGDIVVPTEPATWLLNPDMTFDGEAQGFAVWEGQDGGDLLNVWIGPCSGDASSCTAHSDFGVVSTPSSVEKTVNGVGWGYSDRRSLAAARIGDHVIVVEGIWRASQDVPLLDDPEIVAVLDGLRVGSSNFCVQEVVTATTHSSYRTRCLIP